MADTDVLLGGLGLFGGRGEYLAKLRIFDLGDDGGENEPEGEILIDMDERTYECPARHKYSMMFDDPVPIQANRWYLAWARISGEFLAATISTSFGTFPSTVRSE